MGGGSRSDKAIMKGRPTAADPRNKVSMKKIFGRSNRKKDGTLGKVCAAGGSEEPSVPEPLLTKRPAPWRVRRSRPTRHAPPAVPAPSRRAVA